MVSPIARGVINNISKSKSAQDISHNQQPEDEQEDISDFSDAISRIIDNEDEVSVALGISQQNNLSNN